MKQGAIGSPHTVHIQYHRPPNNQDRLWEASGGSKLRPGASMLNTSLGWRTDPAVAGTGGYFRDKGSHQFDILQLWFGRIVSIPSSIPEPLYGFTSADVHDLRGPGQTATNFRICCKSLRCIEPLESFPKSGFPATALCISSCSGLPFTVCAAPSRLATWVPGKGGLSSGYCYHWLSDLLVRGTRPHVLRRLVSSKS